MSSYISNTLAGLLALFPSRKRKRNAPKSVVDIAKMVEHVVEVVDPRIRVIGRYAKKITPPLAHTWDYLTDIANVIPGGVTLSRATFSSDPRIKLIISSLNEIQQLLETINPLIEDKRHIKGNTPSHVYMLLCMEKNEHNFLGAELAGDIIKRDVMQTRVTFFNHKFLSAGYTEEDAKQGFKKCALEGLLLKAHDLVMQSHNEQKQLIERKKQLHQQLHTKHDSPFRQPGGLFSRNDYLVDAPPELLDIERQLTEIRIRSESPDHHLSKTIEILNNPEQYLKVERQSVMLNNFGIKIQGDAMKNQFNIEYAEVEIEQALKHVTMIVSGAVEEIFYH